MRIRPLSLGAKLNVALVLFLVVLAAATTALMLFGFNRTRDNATATSRDGLEDAGRERMLLVASDQAAFGVLQMQWASDAGQLAARYMFDLKAGGGAVPGEDVELARSENGILYDPDAERTADVVLPAFAPHAGRRAGHRRWSRARRHRTVGVCQLCRPRTRIELRRDRVLLREREQRPPLLSTDRRSRDRRA